MTAWNWKGNLGLWLLFKHICKQPPYSTSLFLTSRGADYVFWWLVMVSYESLVILQCMGLVTDLPQCCFNNFVSLLHFIFYHSSTFPAKILLKFCCHCLFFFFWLPILLIHKKSFYNMTWCTEFTLTWG